MNFDFMPGLHWQFGYPVAIGIMVFTTIGMLVYFYRQGWIFRGR
jgi:magnesium transporter